MKENKKKISLVTYVIGLILLAVIGTLLIVFIITRNNSKIDYPTTDSEIKETALKELPLPEITGGARGELGIDKNINESTIDEYLGRDDSVYRDMRMLEDPGNYEKIGGDRFLSGYVEGFEVIPLPYIIPVTGLPSEVGDTYTGTTLFYEDNGTYKANYKESMDIIEEIFPKDKVIFLMCGGGGYSGMTKNFLVSLGWDENKIYNTGGYWYYKGEHGINVKKEINGKVSYDFDSVPYHKIDFNKLTKSEDYKEPIVKVSELKINTSKIELEEGTSFKLNAIVLPNDATNKEVKWTSNDENVATVTRDGLVQAIGPGNATITVESVEEGKKVICEVMVNKKIISTQIKIDDVSKEAKKFEEYNFEKIYQEFSYIDEEMVNNSKKTKYYNRTEDGGYILNDLGKKEYKKQEEKLEKAQKEKVEILNKLIDEKKSFIILIRTKECEEKEYSVLDGTKKILKQNNYSYLDVGTSVLDGDETLEKSKLDTSKLGGSIAIIKDGKIYASIDPDTDAIKNDEETKNWLNKYIEIK